MGFFRPHVLGMTLPVKQDEPSDPIYVRLLGAQAVVLQPTQVTHLIKQPWRSGRAWSL